MLEPQPVRIYKARRAAVESNLTGAGMAKADADRWLSGWEAQAANEGLGRDDRDFWTKGTTWIDASRGSGPQRM